MGGSGRPTLQIMAEPLDRSLTMTVDDCATISRAVSAVLDEADPIAGEYSLEVSTPGLDRPLITEEHFRRFVGEKARIETAEAVEGRKRFVGVLAACDGKTVTIITEAADYVVPLASVRSAKLVLETTKQAPARPARTR